MQIPKAFCLLVRAASLLFLEGLGFMAFAKPNTILSPLLIQWKSLLQQWAKGGSLAIAAQEALLLSGIPEGLQILIDEWAAADFKSLPEVELLSAADISSAMGAYAISTAKIYLNENWLEGAKKEDVFAVLTEELGHHLDGVLNAVDTPGDEGELFSQVLGGELLSDSDKQALRRSNDTGTVLVKGAEQNIENSSPSKQTSWIKQYGTAGYEISNGLTVASDGKIWTVTTGRYLIDGQTKTNDSENYITIFNPDGTLSSSLNAGPIASQIIAGVSSIGDRVYVGGQTIAGTIDGQVNSWGKTGYLTSYDLSGKKIWTRVLPGYTGTRSITSDSSGIYSAGFTYFGLNGSPSLGGADAFLAKHDTQGNLLWTRIIGGNGDNANGGTNQVSGNGSYVAVAGYTNQAIDGQSEASGGFVSLFSASGKKLWTRIRTEGIGPVHIAQDNSTYISGSKAGTTDIYVTKLDINGNPIWTNTYGSTGTDYPIQLSINKEGELFVLGGTTGSYSGYTNAGEYDNVFLRIDPSTGSLIKATQWGFQSSDQATQFSFASDGTLFIAGSVQSALPGNTFSGGTYDPYLIRFDVDTPTYTLIPSATSINEGAVLTSTVTTTNVATGTKLYYSLSGTGITTADFAAGALTGEGVTDATGKFTFTHTLANDLTTEGAESLSIKLYSDTARTLQVGSTATVSVVDSSTTAPLVVRGNSLYTIVDGPSWTQAEANSVKLGGHLVTINDAAERRWLSTNLYGNKLHIDRLRNNSQVIFDLDGYFVGLNDKTANGIFQWAGGNATNWVDPSDYIHPAYFADKGYLLNGFEYGAVHSNSDGLGPDIVFNLGDTHSYYANDGIFYRGIAETPFIRRGDSGYVIVSGPTWEEAEANSVKLGGHLVTINDAEENEWIKSNFSSYKSVSSGGADFWIGLTDKTTEGQFEWVDGTPFAYSGFYNGGVGDNGSQNGMGNYPTYDPPYTSANWWLGKQLEFDRSIGEDYGLINAPSGNWNDLPNNHRDGSVGIAEIELAPNNTPTGTPTVTGTLKVGFTLTIDATTIKDSDNFTGYTPTFKYNWETSTDGTTWSKLTTTDGADNNNTYILTAAETSKKIRGVVSYLDGYGTNEVVNSVTSESTITPAGLPTQSLTLSAPSKTAIRSGISTTSAITYNVSTGNTALTGVGASLYFDSTQLSVSIAGDPFKTGLLGNAITADTSNADGDPKTDKVLSLSYLDFGGNFPGSGTTLPLTLANLNLVPTTTFSGSTLHLKGDPAIGFTATGADLSIAHNAAPVVNGSIPALSTNRYTPFSYTLKSDLFSDPDSSITLSATTNTGDTLPSWLTFNPTTRTLSGTPTIGGTINLNLSATDELGSISTPLSLKIKEVQSLSSSTTPIRYQRNKELTVPINYSTSDGSSTTGLSFKVHFNSSLLSFDSTTGITNKTQADLFQIGAIQQDTANSDNDATTDSFIPINIASFTGQFPTAGVPVKLADLIFKSLDKPIDPITGLKDTSINFSETEAASGYGFTATSASLKPLSFSLDVDRDGKVTALGDGLMIIRKLFGAAFAGDALINKAISPDSPYLNGIAYNTLTTQQKADVAAQVHANIQEGIDSKMLDVDKDGKTTALGDGLMVIRHLFGAAFAGAALTNKAISPDSPYFGPPANFAAVAANIDAMRPI